MRNVVTNLLQSRVVVLAIFPSTYYYHQSENVHYNLFFAMVAVVGLLSSWSSLVRTVGPIAFRESVNLLLNSVCMCKQNKITGLCVAQIDLEEQN